MCYNKDKSIDLQVLSKYRLAAERPGLSTAYNIFLKNVSFNPVIISNGTCITFNLLLVKDETWKVSPKRKTNRQTMTKMIQAVMLLTYEINGDFVYL